MFQVRGHCRQCGRIIIMMTAPSLVARWQRRPQRGPAAGGLRFRAPSWHWQLGSPGRLNGRGRRKQQHPTTSQPASPKLAHIEQENRGLLCMLQGACGPTSHAPCSCTLALRAKRGLCPVPLKQVPRALWTATAPRCATLHIPISNPASHALVVPSYPSRLGLAALYISQK